jgi:AcrR family transcriptional regulator
MSGPDRPYGEQQAEEPTRAAWRPADHAIPRPDENADLAAGRERLRQAREAGREAIREARRTARESNREARDSVLASVREARLAAHQAVREAAREVQRARRGEHVTGTGDEADTRTKIQRVGLRLFTERGYEATSLREIAEHLGVTKAALYYHFRSKDEIISSLLDDRMARMNELIEWGETQPRGLETRRELLRRYSDMLYEQDHAVLIQFLERNQSSMGKHPAGSQMRQQMFRLLDLFIEPDAPLTDQIRSSMAIFALHSVWFTLRNPDINEDERSEAALQVALELVE